MRSRAKLAQSVCGQQCLFNPLGGAVGTLPAGTFGFGGARHGQLSVQPCPTPPLCPSETPTGKQTAPENRHLELQALGQEAREAGSSFREAGL